MRFDFSGFVSLWGENYGLWCTLVKDMETPEAAAMLRAAARAFGGLDTMAAGTLARAMRRDAAAGKAAPPPAIESATQGSPGRIYYAMDSAGVPVWQQAAMEDWALLATESGGPGAVAAAAALLETWARAALGYEMEAPEAAAAILELRAAAYGERRKLFVRNGRRNSGA